MLNLDLNRGGAVTADQLKNVQAQIDRLRDLPAMREQAAASEAADDSRRVALLDELSALEIEEAARAGAFKQDLIATQAEIERCRVALRDAQQRHNETELARSTADLAFWRKQSKLQGELNELGEREVEELVQSLSRELLSCMNAQQFREERVIEHDKFGEPWLVTKTHSVTRAMDEHVTKLQSITRDATALKRAKLPVAKVKERAKELRESALIGAGFFYSKNKQMPRDMKELSSQASSVDLSYPGGRSRVEFENAPRFAWQR